MSIISSILKAREDNIKVYELDVRRIVSFPIIRTVLNQLRKLKELEYESSRVKSRTIRTCLEGYEGD